MQSNNIHTQNIFNIISYQTCFLHSAHTSLLLSDSSTAILISFYHLVQKEFYRLKSLTHIRVGYQQIPLLITKVGILTHIHKLPHLHHTQYVHIVTTLSHNTTSYPRPAEVPTRSSSVMAMTRAREMDLRNWTSSLG